MPTVFDVANYYLANGNKMTNKKLQKMVYYAYAWHLTLSNESADDLNARLFENHFEAWVHGAVYPELNHAYKDYGSACLPKYDGKIYDFSPDELNILEQVNTTYGIYDGNSLESINHQEDPWKDARKGLSYYDSSHNPITDEAIFNYFIEQAKEQKAKQ